MSNFWVVKNWNATAFDNGYWIPLGSFVEHQAACDALIAYWNECGQVVEPSDPRYQSGQWITPGTPLGGIVAGIIGTVKTEEPPFPLTGENM